MLERLEPMPVPFYLPESERIRSRDLYSEVFSEDTEKFVNYYYKYKTRDNAVLVLEKDSRIISMLHLNPYTMIINGYELKSNYIVAVATHKDYRHQGYMRILLEKALGDMASVGMPFTFLMPASESIYAPFDFVWICPYTKLPKRVEAMDADAQNRYLAARYQMFCKRDRRYMENMEAERTAEEGETFPEKIPPYMARITDVRQMLRLVRGMQAQCLYLHVKDPIIKKNNGYFIWKISGEGSSAEKLSERPEQIDLDLSVGELASMVFENFRICLSEVV